MGLYLTYAQPLGRILPSTAACPTLTLTLTLTLALALALTLTPTLSQTQTRTLTQVSQIFFNCMVTELFVAATFNDTSTETSPICVMNMTHPR